MTPEQFNSLVTSERSADRRLAGRAIAENPTLVDRSIVEGAFHRETVPQIRQQFASALKVLSERAPQVEEPPAGQVKAISDAAYVKAVRDVTQRVLHQLNPLIGDIEIAASKEIVDFEASKTKLSIGQIRLQADAITKLYNSAKPATLEEFDLSTIIKNCLPGDLDHSHCEIVFAGPKPLLVHGDRSLVTIAVTNGLRNSIEATQTFGPSVSKPTIVVNWAETDRDYWIAILDEGVGIHGGIEGAFEIGTSTKNHVGHGLPGIRAAMLSLQGTATLEPRKDRGCTLALTWPVLGSKK